MSTLISVVLLTVAWAALFSTIDPRGLIVGALIAFLTLRFVRWLERSPDDESLYTVTPMPWGFMLLAVAFLRELVLSAVSVAVQAWRPSLAIRPGIVAVPLAVQSDLEITVLASLISLTPGTLSLEVSEDRRTLFVHALDVEGDGSTIRASIRDRLERPVARAFWVRRRAL